ncbi:WSCD family member CG9164 [Planococcus citri]|uniref:WSCD family member CG9164 n=1 Tax=Planococcus citri TaxID=170843 RepID=UPI0031F80932
MSKRKHKLILLFVGSYVIIIFCLSLHFIHRSYSGFNETNIVYIQGHTYKVIQHKPKVHWCQPLKFLKTRSKRPITALASFPGSGNTWLRYLLQQATGILTGSVYKDYGLLWNGLFGESVTNQSVSVVKTHEWGPATRKLFDRAVLLIRSPGPAILAEFNRRSGGHLGYASAERFTRHNGKEWSMFVMEHLEGWRSMNSDWIQNYEKPLLIVHYEELILQPKKNIENIIKFLGLPINKQHIRCMMRRKEGIYRRRKPYLPFNPFTSELNNVLENQKKVIYNEIKKRKIHSQRTTALSVKTESDVIPVDN